jgi:ubiquinone/menaquinone biosynthesis C-methylase UbiE
VIISNATRHFWSAFLNNDDNLGHASRALYGNDIDDHVRACWRSAQETVAKVKKDIEPLQPNIILEVGASAGLNCFAFEKTYEKSVILGIEPETQAIKVAQSMKVLENLLPIFIKGVGEKIPLPDASVDLILCHIVREHVIYVPKVISEMSRVLAPGGVIHIEAPNCIWPYEPHLDIWRIPLLGKKFVKFCAYIQGKGKMINFLNHLQFIHPRYIETLLKLNSLEYQNRSIEKINSAFLHKADIKQYKKLAKILTIVKKYRLDGIALWLVGIFRLYPWLSNGV